MAEGAFGETLRELRRRRGFSLQKLADRLNLVRDETAPAARRVGKSYLSDLERGAKPPPSRKQVGRLAEALRCSEEERDALYVAAGYVPPGRENGLPEPEAARVLPRRGASTSAVLPPLLPPVTAGGGILLPKHDFVIRADGMAGGVFQEGDVLLVRVVSEMPAGAVAVCAADGQAWVQRWEKPPPAASGRATEGPVRVLGQVVGLIRTF